MAYGMIPAYHESGGVIRTNEYKIANGLAGALFSGDPVALLVTGYITIAVPGSIPLANIGVFEGCRYTDAAGVIHYSRTWPAAQVSTDAVAFVYDDPNIVFKVQSDQDTTPMAQNFVGASGDVVTGTGNAFTKQSAWKLDSSGTWTTTAAMVVVVGSAELDGVWTAAGTPMDVYVRYNEHLKRAPVTGLAQS